LGEERDTRRRLSEAVTADDADEVRRNAHSLKGALGLFGLQQASAAALRLEMIGKQRALDQAPPVTRELERESARIVPELEGFLRQPTPPRRAGKQREPKWMRRGAADPA